MPASAPSGAVSLGPGIGGGCTPEGGSGAEVAPLALRNFTVPPEPEALFLLQKKRVLAAPAAWPKPPEPEGVTLHGLAIGPRACERARIIFMAPDPGGTT